MKYELASTDEVVKSVVIDLRLGLAFVHWIRPLSATKLYVRVSDYAIIPLLPELDLLNCNICEIIIISEVC